MISVYAEHERDLRVPQPRAPRRGTQREHAERAVERGRAVQRERRQRAPARRCDVSNAMLSRHRIRPERHDRGDEPHRRRRARATAARASARRGRAALARVAPARRSARPAAAAGRSSVANGPGPRCCRARACRAFRDRAARPAAVAERRRQRMTSGSGTRRRRRRRQSQRVAQAAQEIRAGVMGSGPTSAHAPRIGAGLCTSA